ncbi:TlpA family protein disulfide reductase [Nonlabens sp. YIK11]|uniref:TlpA family protein disulfide reductase n=1 Tax=Nonlabens sp. YIK11 TaxID=1453349 RepID=UPI0006DC8E16|nr:TlpA disulfide reductase family protein [Nonlabens sp. YIK11]
MKISTVINLLILIVLCSSCEKEKEVEYSIFKGNIKNTSGALQLRPAKGFENESKTIRLDEFGNFNDTLFTDEGLYLLFDGTNMINFFLKPSNTYGLEYDAKKFRQDGIKLTGSDIAFNEYFVEKSRTQVFLDPTVKMTETEYRDLLNDIKTKQLDRLNDSGLSAIINDYEKSKIEYQYLRDLKLFLFYAGIKKPTKESINELNINYSNDEHYTKFGAYNSMVDDRVILQMEEKAKKEKLRDTSYSNNQNFIKGVNEFAPTELIKNSIISTFGPQYIVEAKDKESFYNDFISHYTGNDSIFKNEMSELYLDLSKLQKGTTSPTFQNYKNYTGGLTSLDDFKGKDVLINLWATWCLNCYESIPVIETLVEEYPEVVFLNIAYQDEEKKWRKMIKDKKFAGEHILADRKDESFFEEYAVTGIPRYILIDKNGNIIDNNAPRPTEEGLKILLDSL